MTKIPAYISENGDVDMLPLTVNQTNFVIEEMNLDAKERERALKRAQGGIETDSQDYYDDNDDWFNDPEHHDMFEDDPQTDEELSAQMAEIIDSETQAKLDARQKANEEAYGSQEDSLKTEMEARYARLEQLVESPEEVAEFRRNIANKSKQKNQENNEVIPIKRDEKKRASDMDALLEAAKKYTRESQKK